MATTWQERHDAEHAKREARRAKVRASVAVERTELDAESATLTLHTVTAARFSASALTIEARGVVGAFDSNRHGSGGASCGALLCVVRFGDAYAKDATNAAQSYGVNLGGSLAFTLHTREGVRGWWWYYEGSHLRVIGGGDPTPTAKDAAEVVAVELLNRYASGLLLRLGVAWQLRTHAERMAANAEAAADELRKAREIERSAREDSERFAGSGVLLAVLDASQNFRELRTREADAREAAALMYVHPYDAAEGKRASYAPFDFSPADATK